MLREVFSWGPEQEKAFNAIKTAILNNAVAGANPDLQFHSVVDASVSAVGGVLFQMEGVEAGTEATPKFRENERINMFLSFRLSDAETRYVNSERECLAIVKCLNEVKWLVIGSKLSDKFNKGDSTKAQINTWLDRLSEFDLKVAHRSSRDQHVGLADRLSRMPTRYLSSPIEEIPERMPVRTTIPIEADR